jgi:hypothetical protein
LTVLNIKHVITEAYIPDAHVRDEVEAMIAGMDEHISRLPDAKIYKDHQRVLVFNNTGSDSCYYFVDHEYQSIFWFEDMFGDKLVTEVHVEKEMSRTQFGQYSSIPPTLTVKLTV